MSLDHSNPEDSDFRIQIWLERVFAVCLFGCYMLGSLICLTGIFVFVALYWYENYAATIQDSTTMEESEEKKQFEKCVFDLDGFNGLNPDYVKSVKVCFVTPPYFTGGGGLLFVQLDIDEEHFEDQSEVLNKGEKVELEKLYLGYEIDKYNPKWWGRIHQIKPYAIVLDPENDRKIYFWFDELENEVYAFQDSQS
jgi:hypothetical protein